MKRFKRAISIILSLALMLSITAVPGYAVEDTFTVTLSATSDYEGNNPITKASAGDVIFIHVNFEGNTEENNVCAFDLFLQYDKNLIEISSENDFWGEGPCASAVGNGLQEPGVAFINWASPSGLFVRPSGVLESGTLACLQCTVKKDITSIASAVFSIDTQKSFFANSDKIKIEYSAQELTISVVASNSIGISSESGSDTIAVPTAKTTPATMQYSATVVDDNGDVLEKPVVIWTIDNSSEAVKISNDGLVTVTNKAQAGTYTIKAEAMQTDNQTLGVVSVTAEAKLEITREDPAAADVTVSLGEDTLTVPADGAADTTADITAAVTDQYGDPMDDVAVQYSIEPAMTGISVQGNQVVVTNAAKAGITDTNAKTFTLTATADSAKGETTFTVARAPQEATDVVIYKGDTPITSDTIAVPKGTDSTSVTYTAKVLDQYGTEMTEAAATWSNTSEPSGVIVSGGTITVTDTAQTGNFTLKATYDDKSETVTINIVDIAFEGQPTIKENPVYGDTWGDIVTGYDTNITAKVGTEEIQGTYTLVGAGTMPNAGEQTYEVRFTSEDGTYTNILADTGEVNIAPKPVTVTGITAADKEYDGTTDATLDWSKASVTETVGGDVLTVNSATGAFASKNVGSQTVTISDITLDGDAKDNYTVSASTTTASITAKTLTDLGFVGITVTKTYDGTTNPGTLSGDVTFTGKVESDNVAVSAQPGPYSDANVGADKTITLTLSLTGEGASNYELESTTASFASAAITASSVYTDATATAQNVVVGVGDFAQPTFTGYNGEAVTGTTTYSYGGETTTYNAIKAALATLTAGEKAEIQYTFTASGNYTGTKTGTINVTMVDISFSVADEGVTVKPNATYGDDWSEIVTIDPSKITAKVGEETISGGTYTLEQTGVPSAGNHQYKVLFSGELDGKAYTNVKVTDGTVEVAQKKVTVAGITAADKEYDGTVAAILNTASAQIDGKIGNDELTVTATGAFASKNVGSQEVTITDITLGGAAMDNYELITTTLTATATITAKEVTVTGITAANKEYDGTVAATLNTASAKFEGKVDGDALTATATGAFANADAGESKAVTITNITLGGADVGNYTVSADSQTVTTATINPTDNYTLTVSDTQTVVVDVGTFAQPSASFGGKEVAGTVTYTIGSDADKSYDEAVAILAAKTAGDSVTVTCTFTPTAGGNFTGTKSDDISVTMVDIAFTLAEGAVTEKEAPVYGDDWSKIVTIDPSKITAKVGEETISGTYRLDVSGMPAVGEHGYQVLFTGKLGDKTYTDITVTSGSVTVGKKLVVVTALDRNIIQGQKAPDLSQPKLGTDYTVTGLVGTDVLGGTIVMSYDPAEPDTTKIGTAVINISGATVGNNYEIAFQSGKLTISYIPPYIPGTGGNSNTQVNPDGSTTTTTTSPNGTVTQTTKYPDGSQTVAVTNPDGSASITTTTADGIRAVTTVDASGKTVSNITLSRSALNGVGTKQQPAELPVPAAANADNILGAAVITVNLPAGVESAWVEIPVSNPTMGTVAMISRAGGVEILKTSYVEQGSLVAKVSSGDQIVVVDNSQSFRDVAYTAWEYDAVAFVSSHGLFQGTGENSFSPKATTSRAMVMTVLARLAGYDTEGGATWYEKGMAWSVANGVSDGSNPNGAVSREQFATMLYRYVGSPAVSGSLTGFADVNEISDYAESAMLWAVQNGIMSGKGNGILDPQGSATRAELSQMLMNFIVNVME